MHYSIHLLFPSRVHKHTESQGNDQFEGKLGTYAT